MENTDIKLDGSQFEKAIQPILTSLKEFRELLVALDGTSTGRLKKEMQTLSTSATSVLVEVENAFKAMPAMIAKQVSDTSKAVNKGMRKAGEDAGKEFADAQVRTVRAEKQRVQAEYEAMVSKGWKLKLPALEQAKAAGATLFPSDAEMLKAAADSSRASASVLATQRRFNQESEREVTAQDRILRAKKRLQQEEVSSLEALASGVEAANRKLLANLAKSAQARRELEAAAATERLRVLGKTGAVQFNEAAETPAGRYSISSGRNVGRVIDPEVEAAITRASVDGNKNLKDSTSALNAEKLKLREAQKNLNSTMLDGHGAARGLASAFGALYLTYGRLIPLLAGAAIGNAFTSVVRIGAEVNNTFATIRVLSEETGASVEGLNKQMLELARSGPFGPLEVSKAMKTLSLAGLDASQVSSSIKDVLNFAVAGNTTIEKSADVLTSVSTAFKISALGYNYVGDVIAKTAAVSKSSVESIGEAFKTASVINSQYGVSLEDVSLGLAALSNVGIQGTAAGTALRNTYADLYGRTEQASKALKKLGLDARDGAGNIKPIVQIIAELSDKLSNYTKRGQDNAIKEIFSERGSKEAIQLLSLFQQKSRDAKDTASNLLLDLQEKALKSAGFVINAAAQLSLTPLNQMKSVKAALEATLAESFDAVAPQLIAISNELKKTFGSEEFKNAIQNLAVGFANLTAAIVNNAGALGLLAAAWLTYKVAVGSAAFFGTLTAGAVKLTETYRGLTAAKALATTAEVAGSAATLGATAATAGKAAGLARLLGFLGPIGTGIATAATAWQLYSIFADKSKRSADEISGASGQALLSYYDKEIARLDEINEALVKGITLEKLRASAAGQASTRAAEEEGLAKISQAQNTLNVLEARKAKFASSEAANRPGAAAELALQDKKIASAKVQIEVARESASNFAMELQTRQQVARIRAQDNADEERKRIAKETKKLTGDLDFDLKKPGPGAGVALQAEKAQLKNIQDAYSLIYHETDRLEKEKQNQLKYYADLGLTSEATYFRESVAQSEIYAARRKEILDSETIAVLAQLEVIKAARDRKTTTPENKQLYDAEVAAANNALAKIKEQTEKLADDREQRRLQAQLKTLKPGVDLIQNSEQELRIAENNLQQSLKSLEVKTNLNQLSERDQFIAGETLKLLGSQQDALVKQQAIRERIVKDAGLDNLFDESNGLSAEQRQVLLQFLDKLDATIAKNREVLLDSVGKVKDAAAQAFDSKRINDFAQDIEKSLSEAILNGGKSGAKGLRDSIVKILKEPFRIALNGILGPISQDIARSLLGLIGVRSGTGQGAGFSSTVSAASNLNSTFGAASQYLYGGTAGASTASLAYANGIGALGGDSLGALITANGSWAGVGTVVGNSAAQAIAANLALEAGTAAALPAGTIAAAGSAGAVGAGASGVLAAIPGWGWAAAAALAIFGGDLLGGIFGGGQSVRGQGFEGKFASNGFSGSNYRDVHTDGGWFGSDSDNRELSSIDENLRKGLSTSYAQLKVAASGAALALGLSADSITNYSQAVSVAMGSDAQANEKAIADLLNSVGENLANTIAPGIGQFKKTGETSAAALQRLGLSLSMVNTMLTELQMTLIGVSLVGGAAASKLVDSFGGIEQLASASKAYYDTYYTESERYTNSLNSIRKVFSALNLEMPESKESFRGIVQALDLNTDSGLAAYAALVKVAPEFAAVTESMERFAADAAAKIIGMFTGQKGFLPALDASRLKLDAVSSRLTKTSGAVGQISQLFLNASSPMVTFGVTTAAATDALTDAQKSAADLNVEILTLKENAGEARTDFRALSLALNKVDTATFTNTVMKVFEKLASRIKSVLSDASNERVAVRQAALQIISPTAMSRAAIQSGISRVTVNAPNPNTLIAARQTLAQNDRTVALRQSELNAIKTVTPAGTALASATQTLAEAKLKLRDAEAFFNSNRDAEGGKYAYWSNSGYDGTQTFNSQFPSPDSAENRGIRAGREFKSAQDAMGAIQAEFDRQQALTQAANATQASTLAQKQLELADAAAIAAASLDVARQAQLDYIGSIENFSVDSDRAVSRLSALREETLKYYEAQKQLSGLMQNSASTLRKTVQDYRFNSLDTGAQFNELQTRYATAYSMALSTDGSVLAGYGDELNSLLNPLLEKARDVYATEGEFNSFVATALARADNIAARIDELTPTNYAQESLDILATIDTTLASIENSTRAADRIIADAIEAGTDKTANGLRAVIAALTGQAIPAFAGGGDFPGGLRIVGENGPELEATGASRIFNAGQTRDMLSGGLSNQKMEAAMEAQNQRLERMSAELQAIALSNASLARYAERNYREGTLIRNETDAPVYTKAVV